MKMGCSPGEHGTLSRAPLVGYEEGYDEEEDERDEGEYVGRRNDGDALFSVESPSLLALLARAREIEVCFTDIPEVTGQLTDKSSGHQVRQRADA
ncbi:hypothetical protein F7725_025161 [Dissostichus mawsoni]|uniref:Uncharacterized protein n=1 Tax=Dissostichus mawsoni TaxID=36200 RepID=A0A7J5XBG6_DISMA|nr:hypothetical protein F7725_025161 [Dissostichus mawsoni]